MFPEIRRLLSSWISDYADTAAIDKDDPDPNYFLSDLKRANQIFYTLASAKLQSIFRFIACFRHFSLKFFVSIFNSSYCRDPLNIYEI
jgi:hypothetical protein